MLINAEPLLYLLRGYRIVHFDGGFGKGKTAMSYRLAYELLERFNFRYLLSNCNDVWSNNPSEVIPRPNDDGVPTFLDTVIILDEAGIVFEDGGHVKQFTAFMRKFNVVLLMPSVDPPPGRVKFLQCQRRFNFNVLGFPLWWYQARLSTGLDRVSYGFGWWRPSEIFGVYDTNDFPADDYGIGAFIEDETTKAIARRKKQGGRGRRSPRFTVSADNSPGAIQTPALGVSPVAGGGWSTVSAFQDAAEEISYAVSVLDQWQGSKKRRRRWS